MLTVKRKNGMSLDNFASYREAHQLITLLENAQVKGSKFRYSNAYWAFTVFSPEQLEQLEVILEKSCNREVMRKAIERKVSMLDVCEGNPNASRQYLLDKSVDLESLRKDWCRNYFEDCGFVLSEGGE